jgi:predicted anti-sigma-YlaC factor YlaD
MNHADVRKLFQSWMEGRVDTAARSRIQQHLDACGDCKRYYDAMSLLLEKPDRSLLPRIEPDPFLPARIKALAAEGPGTQIHAKRFAFVRMSVIAAVCAVAVAAGVFLGTGLSSIVSRSYDDTAVVKAYSSALSQSGIADAWEEAVAYGGEDTQQTQ